MNLLLAILGSIVFVALGKAGVLTVPVAQALVRYVLAVNLALMFFNLIPLGPLDGAAVLAGILPESAQPFVEALRRYGMGVLFLLLLTGAMRYVMYPAQVLQSAWVDRLVRMVS
jgi:Zn-dependent protease